MENWDDLKFFLAVSRAGTIRGGADLLHANHTTVARRITVMEDHIGSRLFDRSTTGLVLTQLGEDLMPYALRIEGEMTSASRIIVGRDAQPAGTVYVTMPHGLAMTSIMDDLTAFSDTYPDIELDVHFTNDIADLARREARVQRDQHRAEPRGGEGQLQDLEPVGQQASHARAASATQGRPVGTVAELASDGTAATTGAAVGSAVLWEEAGFLRRPIHGGPLRAAMATASSSVSTSTR